jgi:hypothetical protein
VSWARDRRRRLVIHLCGSLRFLTASRPIINRTAEAEARARIVVVDDEPGIVDVISM